MVIANLSVRLVQLKFVKFVEFFEFEASDSRKAMPFCRNEAPLLTSVI